WLDKAMGLHVGPQSAGSSPGPACYGRGGTEPTVTDANVCLGYLNPDYFLGDEMKLDKAASEAALEAVASQVDMSVADLASGVYTIVNSAMAGRVSVILAEKGYDASEFSLVCFGGAGAAHAPAIIHDLGIPRVIVPLEAPAFSAAG